MTQQFASHASIALVSPQSKIRARLEKALLKSALFLITVARVPHECGLGFSISRNTTGSTLPMAEVYGDATP